MNKSDVKKFKNVLQAAVIELDSSMRGRYAIAIESSADRLDRTAEAAGCEMGVLNLEAMAAKRRAISAKRLAVVPAAEMCIRRQEALDRRNITNPVRQWLSLAA